MSLFPRLDHPELATARRRMTEGQRTALSGLWGASAVLAAQAVSPDSQWIVHITATPSAADDAANDWGFFAAKDVVRFPSVPLVHTTDEDDANLSLHGDRMSILVRLLESEEPGIVTLPFQALLTAVPTPDALLDAMIHLATGRDIPPADLARQLVKAGYERVDLVEYPGQYALRGGVMDIFPLHCAIAARLDYFGDTLEAIRWFDADSQRSIESTDGLTLYLEPMMPEMMRGSFLDYLPDNATIWLDPGEEIQSRVQTLAEELDAKELKTEFKTLWNRFQKYAGGVLTSLPMPRKPDSLPFRTHSVQRFQGNLTGLKQDIERILQDVDELVIACPSEGDTHRMEQIVSELELDSLTGVRVETGNASTGFLWPEVGIGVVDYHALFNRVHQRRAVARKKATREIENFLDLNPGDYVVHLAHGIGRFIGNDVIEQEGRREEAFQIEFADRVKLSVPASRVNVLQKYIGSGARAPRLSTIGGKDWINRTARAAKAVEKLAEEMLEVQAMREGELGIAYPADTEWQIDFEASFPYDDTDDQVVATEQIARDMHADRPMDRLICGDVGYGKTELAMRAAFRAATSGKQVAVLVPTTLLAQQHFQTFVERMASYPVTVDVLSRFRTKKEQREVLERLARGGLDIVIGTHRLVQKDVQFKDLGLVVIDEEQRFGVEHKEMLKNLRATTDVLTLTATPIPRTLHMALLGIRDITTLTTPPRDRHAIQTRVAVYDEEMIRSAIIRELNRDGQVFFVHNRVHNIEEIQRTIANIVPEARFVIGHGQMNEHELEEAMSAFMEREADVLVSTTIIESGLDIPNANTLIVNDADQYGLADLHQLRGRVGRYRNQAYSYFLVPRWRTINEDAKKRLKAIEEFNELGAGFKIAMRDLEIRGVGNLLGREQHGHISAVGYEMYCSLLETAVRRMKDESVPERLDPQLDLPIEAYIPEEFIGSMSLRMDLYRRFARVRDEEEIKALVDEVLDRFGTMPTPVRVLTAISRIRIWATHARIYKLTDAEDGLIATTVSPEDADKLVQRWQGSVRRVDPKTLVFVPGMPWPECLIAAAKEAMPG